MAAWTNFLAEEIESFQAGAPDMSLYIYIYGYKGIPPLHSVQFLYTICISLYNMLS